MKALRRIVVFQDFTWCRLRHLSKNLKRVALSCACGTDELPFEIISIDGCFPTNKEIEETTNFINHED